MHSLYLSQRNWYALQALLAQWIARWTSNPKVVGSSPTQGNFWFQILFLATRNLLTLFTIEYRKIKIEAFIEFIKFCTGFNIHEPNRVFIVLGLIFVFLDVRSTKAIKDMGWTSITSSRMIVVHRVFCYIFYSF